MEHKIYGPKIGLELKVISMNKVAILYVCTGKYIVFWDLFYKSYEEYFLPNSEKEYFVFTDADSSFAANLKNVHVIYQKQQPWPYPTLLRYHMFQKISNQLKEFDYTFFMNSNCQCVATVSEEEFLPKKGLLVVSHPGFFDKTNDEFTYDRNEKSTAYIPYGTGEVYVCGGVNGGRSEAFAELIDTIVTNVDRDNDNHIIAKWHDESHINRYIVGRNDYTLLSPSYCYPEGWDLPFDCKILIREKSKWIDVTRVKRSFMSKVIAHIQKWLSWLKK